MSKKRVICGIPFINKEGDTVIRCPYCGAEMDESNFPDLFYEDADNTKGLNDQCKLLEELQSTGFNVVTCGNCGDVLITKITSQL